MHLLTQKKTAWNFQRDGGKCSTMEYTNEKHTVEQHCAMTASQLAGGYLGQVVSNLFPNYICAPSRPEANPIK